MAKQNKIHTLELHEVLMQQIYKSDKTNQHILEETKRFIQKLENTTITVDATEFRKIQTQSIQETEGLISKLINDIEKRSETLAKLNKKFTYNGVLYLSLFSLLLVIATTVSLYVAIDHTIDYNDHQETLVKLSDREDDIILINRYFKDDPKAQQRFAKWLKNK